MISAIGTFVAFGSIVAFVHFRREFVDSYYTRYEPDRFAKTPSLARQFRKLISRNFRGPPDFTPSDDPIIERKRKQQLLAIAALPISFAFAVGTAFLDPHVSQGPLIIVGLFWLAIAWIDELRHLSR